MYLRSTQRRNKDGSEVRYLQLAHNVWDPVAKRSRVQVVYNFGREEPAAREALERLVASVSRHLDPGRARSGQGLELAESRPLGGTWALAALGAARDRPGGAGPAEGPEAGPAGGAGAVRADREPGAGPVLEAGRGPLGERGRADHGAAGDD